MSNSETSNCRGALEPGLLVEDHSGARKRITRVQGDNVYWEYLNPPLSGPREGSTPYEEFVDSHFVLPRT